MADNIIKRIIQLVLDPASAKKTQDDANAVASGIETGWKGMAEKVAGYLGAAFVIDKIVNFGKAAVTAAGESQQSWVELRGAVDATGGSFDDMSDKLHATAAAFEDATTHSQADFTSALTKMIVITGSTSSSLHNMGLVADVAARFFNGDLNEAATLVGKVMDGNVTRLQRMGIQVKSAQEGLEVLAQRSFGAATEAAGTFNGQMSQMDNAWNKMLVTLGTAIISSGGATNGFAVLRAAIQTLTDWIITNKTEISLWVTNGIRFAIEAADVFIRSITGMADILAGGFMSAVGLAAVGIAKLESGYAAMLSIGEKVDKALGVDTTAREASTKALKDQAQALEDWGKTNFDAAADRIAAGVKTLSTPLFSPDQFKNAPKPGALPGEGDKPVTTEGMIPKNVQAQIDAYVKAGKEIEDKVVALGDSFDDVGADVARTTKLLSFLQEQGIDPVTVGFGGLTDKMKFLATFTDPFNKALEVMTKTIGEDLVLANVQAGTSIGAVQANVTRLTADQAALSVVIKAGVTDRKTETEVYKAAVVQYDEVTEALKTMQSALFAQKAEAQLNEDLAFSAINAGTALDKLVLRQKTLQAEVKNDITLQHTQTQAYKDKVVELNKVTDAIHLQTVEMQLQTATADLLADVLGSAMQGGIHAAAVTKSKTNAIDAAEMAVRAGVYALFGDEVQATAAIIMAGQFAGIAAAWGALAAATPGGSSSGSAVSVSTAATPAAPASALASSRASSSSASSSATVPSADVSIYMIGPGFDAMNPSVQRVVWGAQQQAEERFGPNAVIRVRSPASGG